MADSTFGFKLGVEGEKEFKKALSGINQQFKVLGSEMTLVTSQFGKQDKSVEALSARNGVLNKEIAAQKEKIEVLRDALQNASDSFGENDRRTQAWQIQLNNAEAALNNMERELEDNNTALENAAEGMDDAGDNAEKMADDVEDAGNESDKAGEKFDKLGSIAKAAGVAVAAAFAAVSAAAIAAGKALIDMTREGAAFADSVLTESTVTGIATDKLQEYMYAAELVDVSTETLTGSMAKNIKSMSTAASGTGATAEAYKKLGVAVTNTDGSLRDSDDVYWELIDSLGKVENETERDALAMQILGKSAQDLNPLILAGSQRMNELGKQAHDAGYVISDEMLNAYGALDDQLQYLSVGATAAKNALGTILLPVLTSLAEEGVDLLGEFTNGVLECNGDISKLTDVINELLPQVLDTIMEFAPELLTLIGNIIAAVGQAIVDNLPMIVETSSQIILSLLDGLIAALPQLAQGALQLVLALVNGIIDNLPAIIEAAIQVVLAIVQGITNALPTLIPAIVQAILLVTQTLLDNLPLLLDAVIQLIEGIVQGILDSLPLIIEALPEIITAIIDFILGAIPQIIQMVIDIVMAIVEALPTIIQAIIEAIPAIIDGIISAVLENLPLIVQAGIDLFVALIGALPTIIETIVKALPQIISAIINAIIENLPLIIEAGVQLFVSLIANLPTIIIEIVKAVPQIIIGIVEAFGEGIVQMVEVGKNLVLGLWDGICSLASWLWDQVSGWISGIWDGICGFFGIHSPSRKMAWIGEMLVEGLSNSITDNGKEAVDAAETLASDITGVMNGLAGEMETTLPTDFTVNGMSNLEGNGLGTNGAGTVINIYPQTLDAAAIDYLFARFNARLGAAV